MKTLRLLAIIEASTITGPGKNLLEFARLGKNHGIEVSIATFTRSASQNLFTETARNHGIPIEVLQERGAFDTSLLRSLVHMGHRLQPDLLQTHAVKSHFLTRASGLAELAPWIAFHHGYTWPSLRARLYNQLDRWSLRAAQRVVTVSLPFAAELIAHGVKQSRIEVVHNAIRPDWGARDAERGAALRETLRIPALRKVVLIVGRLSLEKDHRTLLAAIRGLPSSLDPHLVIVGEGPERNAIEEHVRQLGLADRVTLTGQQPSAEPYYGIADVAVLSSRTEGSPNVLLEAMAAGVPVVATSVGGIPEIVTDGVSALLVPPGAVEPLQKAIARVLNQPELSEALVQRGRMRIQERHTPEARAERLARIYREAATSR